ncbi:hypothetical protein M086_3331, partial [Bacteroides fragilis str. S13 L11]
MEYMPYNLIVFSIQLSQYGASFGDLSFKKETQLLLLKTILAFS